MREGFKRFSFRSLMYLQSINQSRASLSRVRLDGKRHMQIKWTFVSMSHRSRRKFGETKTQREFGAPQKIGSRNCLQYCFFCTRQHPGSCCLCRRSQSAKTNNLISKFIPPNCSLNGTPFWLMGCFFLWQSYWFPLETDVLLRTEPCNGNCATFYGHRFCGL